MRTVAIVLLVLLTLLMGVYAVSIHSGFFELDRLRQSVLCLTVALFSGGVAVGLIAGRIK